jgi:hypothetical protein
MIQKIKTLVLTTLSFAVLAATPVAFGGVASAANIQDNLCSGANLEINGDTNCASDAGVASDKVNSMITKIINIFSAVVGIAAVIMIIWGGFKYITSGGDSGKVTGAKNTIIYAIIGLIIVALAQFIVKFVLDKAISTT